MNLSQLLNSLSDSERDFIAGLDYGAEREAHRKALDTVIEHAGDVDFNAEGYWFPYEVIELGKNWLQEGHEREFAACMGIVLRNIQAGRDRSNDLDYTLTQHYDSIQQLPADLRELIDSLIEAIMNKSEPGATPNGGPATPLDNSEVPEGPPSVS
ncbi:MAG: hypothetical protein WCH99_07515 [Verrucomicrobiota bacterium]